MSKVSQSPKVKCYMVSHVDPSFNSLDMFVKIEMCVEMLRQELHYGEEENDVRMITW